MKWLFNGMSRATYPAEGFKIMIKDEEYFFCFDCKKCRDQKFHCEMSDKTLLYICKTCGCENSLEDDEGELVKHETL